MVDIMTENDLILDVELNCVVCNKGLKGGAG